MDENSILAMPFVPLRGIVVYPKLLSHIDIGREKSLAAVDYAMEHDRLLVVSAQVDEEVDDPGFDDVYQCGTSGSDSAASPPSRRAGAHPRRRD